jgi:AcrR family transcriptional regulator
MPARDRYTQDELELAIDAARGVRSDIAKVLGCSVRTVYNYLARYPKLLQRARSYDVEICDIAENALFAILANPRHPGHTRAVLFTLRCKGKDNGWDDRLKVEHSGEVAQTHMIDLSELKGDKLDAVVEGLITRRSQRALIDASEVAEAK